MRKNLSPDFLQDIDRLAADIAQAPIPTLELLLAAGQRRLNDPHLPLNKFSGIFANLNDADAKNILELTQQIYAGKQAQQEVVRLAEAGLKPLDRKPAPPLPPFVASNDPRKPVKVAAMDVPLENQGAYHEEGSDMATKARRAQWGNTTSTVTARIPLDQSVTDRREKAELMARLRRAGLLTAES